ncbi:TPA: hypothetical protein L9K60_000041 [Klebsiella quasipneumoniae subsp. quasipneumoniae]|nr:hypothetical protein [Klebsiella quasipneumoniae subsp. quasipneumoniae]
MPFTISKILKVNKSYPEILLEVDNGSVEVDVTYTVIALESMTANTVTVWYQRTVSGVMSALKQPFSFQYSGNGNPIDEAESALRIYMEKSGSL